VYLWPIWIVGAAAVVWLAGDLLYSILMKRRYARWTRGIERDADGVRRGCREYTTGNGDIAILLVHGFGDSAAIWQRIAPALAGRGFTCRVMRLPGFGMPMGEYRKTSSAQWVAAVGEELKTLRQSHARVVVVAHSLGAAVTLGCLADHPDAAAAVVLLAPLIDVCNKRSPLLPVRTWYRILDSLLLFTDVYVPRFVFREMFALIRRNRGRVSTLAIPLLMILAKDDPIVDNRAAERFYRDYPGTVKKLLVVEDAGHILPMDRCWEKLVLEIDRFAGELPA
jgi:alpha-beta hydrolase superfamily lysophospholipase